MDWIALILTTVHLLCMPIPDYQTLMLPVLRHAAGGERRVGDVQGEIADEFGLSAAEREQLLPSGKQGYLHNRIHWAKFHLTKAEMLRSPARGRFVATDAGKELLARRPSKIDVALLAELSPTFRDFVRGQRNPDSSDVTIEHVAPRQYAVPIAPIATPEEQIESAHRALQAALASDLLQRILQNSPSFFERLIIELLVKMGYGGNHADATKQLGKSGDGGVDGVINEDRLGLDRVYIQAKCYAADRSIGRPDVQGFLGSLVGQGAAKGVFVTTSGFSSQAREFVRHLPQRIVLIDGETLAALMMEHGVGVRTNRTIEFKKLDEDFFSDEE
jgi:restriction system protein